MLNANWPLLVTHYLPTQCLSKPECADQKAHVVKNALKLNHEVAPFIYLFLISL